MRNLLCLLGFHEFGEWVAHTNGPCLEYNTPMDCHVFRYCKRCHEMQNLFATINNGGISDISSAV